MISQREPLTCRVISYRTGGLMFETRLQPTQDFETENKGEIVHFVAISQCKLFEFQVFSKKGI